MFNNPSSLDPVCYLADSCKVGWIGTVALMMKTQFGLGILSIPSALNTLGLVPGIICVVAIGGVTTWSNYMIGVFKLRHPDVYGVDDVGEKLFGPIGREVFALCLCICKLDHLPLHLYVFFRILVLDGMCKS